jgi:phenylalanyl-tRNA synthetase alpha chain
MIDRIETYQTNMLAELGDAQDAAGLEAWRLKHLAKSGQLNALLASLKDVPKEHKPAVGARLNAAKQAIEAAFADKQASLGASLASSTKPTGPKLDMTEPGLIDSRALGRRHILMRVRAELVEVFGRLGFEVAEGPELEDDEHNFVKLNIPPGHPAREPIDNFYVDPPGKTLAPRMLRSQTSTVQVRMMEDAVKRGWGPPIKIISPGRVYRPDTVDATHSFMFHQIEGLWIDRADAGESGVSGASRTGENGASSGVTMADLKTTLLQFARAYFGDNAEIRLRPSFFPFTEPSAELDMMIALKPGEPPRWIELGGCGMVHPRVLERCGIDPEHWQGLAFGFGIERIAMGKYGIPDIRMLFENDVRFLQQL